MLLPSVIDKMYYILRYSCVKIALLIEKPEETQYHYTRKTKILSNKRSKIIKKELKKTRSNLKTFLKITY